MFLHFHDGQPVEYEDTCPNEECEAARLAGEMPPLEYAEGVRIDG